MRVIPGISRSETPSLLIICHSSQWRLSDDSFNLSATDLHRQNRTVLSVQAVTMAYGAKQAG